MTNRLFRAGVVVAFLFAMNAMPASSAGARALAIEANVLVAHAVAVPHTESDEAVNPLNSKNIVGATEVLDNGTYNRTYASLDGGNTWKDTTPPQARSGMTGDPRVIFTNRGTALFISLNLLDHRTDVYRSTDGGLTWASPFHFKLFDHELAAVDRTHGSFSNRVYIAGEGDKETKNAPAGMGGIRYIWMYVSDDDGRTFNRISVPESGLNISPKDVYYAGGVAVNGVAVLSDGSVVLSMLRYQPAKSGIERNSVAISHDGGKTFGKPVFVVDDFFYTKRAAFMKKMARHQREGDVSDDGQILAVAADTSAGPYRDRIYTVWPDRRPQLPRIAVRYSSDAGKTWSALAHVGSVDPSESQFQPMIAVNNNGAVLITWFSTAGFPRRDRFNVYASVSTDGGKTFSAPVRVSSQTSNPRVAGNLLPVPLVYDKDSLHAPGFISGYSRWGAGGDYVGLDSDSDGVFHLYWPDSRGTEFQMYAARIHVGDQPAAPESASGRDVSNDVVPFIDPIKIDAANNEVYIPIRLRNISGRTLYGPMSAAFVGLQNTKIDKRLSEVAPDVQILNATSGGRGPGAAFDYSTALGSFGALAPGGVSEPIVWRFRLSDIDNLGPISLRLRITARY